LPSNFKAAPRFRSAIRLLAVALMCLACGGVRAARAQAPPETPPDQQEPAPAAPPVITRVQVVGNSFTDSTRILRTFDVRAGQKFSADAIRRGQKKLLALGLFSDMHISQVRHPADNTVEIVIEVTERPRLANITFEGMKQRESSDLEKKLILKAGEPSTPTAISVQIDSLLKYYHDEGFTQAKITAKADTIEGENRVNLRFVVDEGFKVRITAIRFEGMSAFHEGELRKAMKTKKHWLLGGGEIKDEEFKEDKEKLEGWYHDHGYRDMQVVGTTLEKGALPRDLTLVVKIDEGRLYWMGRTAWEGNKVVPTAVLMRQWPKTKAGPQLYSAANIQKCMGGAYGEYSEQGYLYIGIEPHETVVKDSVVDITFAVNEVPPSHIKRLSITGNKGTREKVIRREINIREGDLFRRSALMRARDDVMRLGIFNEVNPDFTPAESTDVNLVFKVVEKQVGTASAGAGYTNEAGLTGFLEIGHNNVLGNGQQLSLHLERGGKRQDYRLSFTEPWFHDSPTLLGFSGYNTTRILDEYDQGVRGVSGQIGRPLPWPDYSHGSMSYTIERVLFSNPRPGIPLTGIEFNVPLLTSTLSGTLLRNSANNPFYPTKGTRLTVNGQFTGGPFGGDLNYLIWRTEGRAYLPSITRRVTSMFRLRLATANTYPWIGGTIPDNVKFRLGGGNTIDPLRGYDDFMIVPKGNIHDQVDSSLVLRDNNNDGVLDTSYVKRTTRIRYPGGRYLALFTFEQQFPIAHPLHGLLFFDAGNVWNLPNEIRPFDLKVGAGIGFRMEIPILGNIGFDYGYGFHRDDRPRWVGHFMLGNVNF
jgi:outer membrane protein insertion porin family